MVINTHVVSNLQICFTEKAAYMSVSCIYLYLISVSYLREHMNTSNIFFFFRLEETSNGDTHLILLYAVDRDMS